VRTFGPNREEGKVTEKSYIIRSFIICTLQQILFSVIKPRIIKQRKHGRGKKCNGILVTNPEGKRPKQKRKQSKNKCLRGRVWCLFSYLIINVHIYDETGHRYGTLLATLTSSLIRKSYFWSHCLMS